MPAGKNKSASTSAGARKAAKAVDRKHPRSVQRESQQSHLKASPPRATRAIPARKSSATRSTTAPVGSAETYRHDEKAVQRPEVGVQHSFFAKKPPKTYRYDSSLDPALAWDENGGRELAEWLIGLIERAAAEGEAKVFATPQVWVGGGVTVENLQSAARMLRTLSSPYLNWAGKAERHQIEVPTVPLFVHERHSTKAILDGVKHRVARGTTLDLFGDANLDVTDQLSAYEHQGPWANRMILGDSLQVMSSLIEYEGLGGQVQMIYMDPPYGVRFGSNFQPFVRKRDVKHGADEQMTREPEMVKAYRDTWELGLHSYLTYMRDRLLLARELLSESGSIFVQISDENLHHVREVIDEVFGAENFVAVISVKKTTGASSELLPGVADYVLWYAKELSRVTYRQMYLEKAPGGVGGGQYTWLELPDGTRRQVLPSESLTEAQEIGRLFSHDNLTSQRPPGDFPVEGLGAAITGNLRRKLSLI